MGWYDLKEGEEEMVVAIVTPFFYSFEEAELEADPGMVFTAINGMTLIKVGQGDYRPYHFR